MEPNWWDRAGAGTDSARVVRSGSAPQVDSQAAIHLLCSVAILGDIAIKDLACILVEQLGCMSIQQALGALNKFVQI